jgi:hypothetical protein
VAADCVSVLCAMRFSFRILRRWGATTVHNEKHYRSTHRNGG